MDRNYHVNFLRPLEDGDIRHVAENMRRADIDEIFAQYGANNSPRAILEFSAATTPDTRTITSPCGSGEPVAIIGTVPPTLIGPGIARPWMLGTDKIFDHPRAFVMGGRGYVRDMLRRYGKLENHVDVRNVVSVRWLKAIGFKLDEPQPQGALCMLFHRFGAEVHMLDDIQCRILGDFENEGLRHV